MPNAQLGINITADASGVNTASQAVNNLASASAKAATSTTASFTKISTAAASVNKSIAGISGGTKEASFALQSVGRVVSDLPFGPGGIANNLEVLPTAFRSLSMAAKESGQSIASVLLKSLAGPGGLILAFSGVSAALSIATFGLSAWTRLLGKNKETVDEAAEAAKSLKEATKGIFDSVAKESAQVQTLVAVIQSETATRDRRKKAIEDLQKIQPDIFKNLKLEGDVVTGLDESYKKYLTSLSTVIAVKIKQAQLEAVTEKILKQQGITLAGNDKIASNISDTLREQQKRAGGSLAAFAVTQENAERKKLNENLKEQTRLQTEIGELQKGVKVTGNTGKTDAEKDAERISDILDKLKADRDQLERNPLIPGLDKPEKDIQLIEDAIKRLLELNVPEDSTIIKKLIGLEDFGKLLNAELLKNADKFKADPLPVPVDVVPTVSVTRLADIQKRVSKEQKRAALKASRSNVYSNVGIQTNVDLLNSDEVDKNYNRLQKTLDLVTGPLQDAFGDFFSAIITGSGNAFGAFTKAIGQTLAKLVSTLAATAALSGIFALLGVPIGGATGFSGIFSQLTGGLIPNANGGIYSGPTAALVGEYPGAANNPEVIAPLNKLQSMLDFNGGGGSQVFIPDLRIEGPDLVIAFNRAQKAMAR